MKRQLFAVNQTGFEKGAACEVFPSCLGNLKHAFSNKIGIKVFFLLCLGFSAGESFAQGVIEEEKKVQSLPVLSITFKKEGDQSACPSCTLSDLLKHPSLFFKSLGAPSNEKPDRLNSVEYKRRLLSVRLFGAYSSDREVDGYILTIDLEKQNKPTGPFDRGYFSDEKERIKASGIDLTKNSAPFSYRIQMNRDDSLEQKRNQAWEWSGSASYRIAQIRLHNVFLTGGISSASALSSWDSLGIKRPLKVVRLDEEDIHLNRQKEEYLTYEMGLHIEKDDDIFLNVSAFETGITESRNQNTLPVQLVDSLKDSSFSVQGVEVNVGFLLEALEGGAQYIYTYNNDPWLNDAQFVRHLGSLRLGYALTPDLVFGTVYTQRSGGSLVESGKSVEHLDIYSFYDMNKATRMGLVLQNVMNEPAEYRDFRVGGNTLFADRERTLWLRLELQY